MLEAVLFVVPNDLVESFASGGPLGLGAALGLDQRLGCGQCSATPSPWTGSGITWELLRMQSLGPHLRPTQSVATFQQCSHVDPTHMQM